MYCPKCGQRQAAERVRFCSRCGLTLSGVGELLEGSDALSPRQRGVRLGALLMLTSLLVALVQALMPTLVDKLVVLAAPVVICFFVGFVRILYALLFERGAAGQRALAEAARGDAPPLTGADEAARLPPARGVPVSDLRRRADTAEMFEATRAGGGGSVTEGTTRLLERDSGAL